MAFGIHIETISADTAVVTINGPLTLGTSLKIADSQIQSAIEKGTARLIFDMREVAYMDSAGLGALIHTYGIASSKGGTLRLAGVTDRVADLLRMTRTDSLLAMDADVPASLAALS